ncbi:hypothetical protein BDQ17DRAFT_1373284, partial [Cyathus striatus]
KPSNSYNQGRGSGGLDYYTGEHFGGNFGGNGKGGQAYYVRSSPLAIPPQRIGGTSAYPPSITDNVPPRRQIFSGRFNGGNFNGNGVGGYSFQMGCYPGGNVTEQATQTRPAFAEAYLGSFYGGNFDGNGTGGQAFEIYAMNEAHLRQQIQTYGLFTTYHSDGADMYMGAPPPTHNYGYHAGGNYGGI